MGTDRFDPDESLLDTSRYVAKVQRGRLAYVDPCPLDLDLLRRTAQTMRAGEVITYGLGEAAEEVPRGFVVEEFDSMDSADGARRGALDDGDRDSGADENGEGATTGETGRQEPSFTPRAEHFWMPRKLVDESSDVVGTGRLVEGPRLSGVVELHVHVHIPSQSSVGGTSEGTAPAGSASADSAGTSGRAS